MTKITFRIRPNNEEHKRNVLDGLKHKLTYAISHKPLLCIGFHLPDLSLSDLRIDKEFTTPVYFSDSQFLEKADFSEDTFQVKVHFSTTRFQEQLSKTTFQGPEVFFKTNFQEAFFDAAEFQEGAAIFVFANFKGKAVFSKANFQADTDFSNSKFYGKTYFSGQFNGKTNFNYVLFEGKEKVIFDIEPLSNVSFMNSDITGVRFSDKARWRIGEGGEKKVKESRYRYFNSTQR